MTDDPRTACDLVHFLGVDAQKVRVIPLGIDDAFLHDVAPQPAPRPYFLYAGNHREHKDLATLVAAWQSLPPGREADLYLTGADDVPDLRGRVREGGELRFLGEVESARLARLYRGASAYVHPALCEGFGLPMLEAAAAGTRVIACSQSLPSILTGRADTFAPRDVAGLVALLLDALARPLPAERREFVRDYARQYTWDRCATATAEVYRETLAELGSR